MRSACALLFAVCIGVSACGGGGSSRSNSIGAGTSNGTGTATGTGSSTGSGTSTGTGSSTGSGTSTGTGSSTGSGTSTGTGSSTGSGTSTGTGSSTGSGTSTGTGTSGGAGTSTGTGATSSLSFIESKVAGAGFAGAQDGQSNIASFSSPTAVVIDSLGNYFVADTNNHVIRKISANGVVSTFAGNRAAGFKNGIGLDAAFNAPTGLAIDDADNLYVADFNNHRIRRISPSQEVITYSGSGKQGRDGGFSGSASYRFPSDVAVDARGGVYVADSGNHSIRKITASYANVMAGTGVAGFTDSQNATFSNPRGLTVDHLGNVYVADTNNKAIRKISTDGKVTTIISSSTADSLAGFQPFAMAVDLNRTLYVADNANNKIVMISPNGAPSNLPTNNQSPALSAPRGMTIDALGNLIVADSGNHLLKKFTRSTPIVPDPGTMQTIVGRWGNALLEPNKQAARLTQVQGITLNPEGTVFFSDANKIYRVTGANLIGLVAGHASSDLVDGLGELARFSSVTRLLFDRGGNLLVLDSENNAIRKIAANGQVTTLAGGTKGRTDGIAKNASFNFSTAGGMALHPNGDIYIADTYNQLIRKISSNGMVSTVAGNGLRGLINGKALAASFNDPTGLAIDSIGNVFVADFGNSVIRKISPQDEVTTLAGGTPGFLDALASKAQFNSPNSLLLDNLGHLLVVDTGNHAIRKIEKNGQVTTIGGDGYCGVILCTPSSLAIDLVGNLYVTDFGNNRIRKIIKGN